MYTALVCRSIDEAIFPPIYVGCFRVSKRLHKRRGARLKRRKPSNAVFTGLSEKPEPAAIALANNKIIAATGMRKTLLSGSSAKTRRGSRTAFGMKRRWEPSSSMRITFPAKKGANCSATSSRMRRAWASPLVPGAGCHRFDAARPFCHVRTRRLYRPDRGGAEREKHVFSINTLQKAGARLASGTDFPIDLLNPLLQVYRAVTRIDSGGADVWHPHERITLAEALRAYTVGSAYGSFREQELGTLEAGKLADIVVLARNLFAVPVEEIPDTKAVLTIVDGKVVFEHTQALVES